MIRKLKNIGITAILIFGLMGFVACNYEAQLDFPDTQDNQIKISGITYTERDGVGDGTIVRGNTVLFTLLVENALNDSYTVSWSNDYNSYPLTESGSDTALWENTPYTSGTYYHDAVAHDGEHTSMAVCAVTVQNSAPQILDIDYLTSTTGNNTIHLTVQDADTYPETTITGDAQADAGTIFDITAQVVNSGALDFLWMPDGCSEGITVTVDIDVTDDDPGNTVSETVEFWYQP